MNNQEPDEPGRFPNEHTTYLPCWFSKMALERFGLGDPAQLMEELRASDASSYERVGVDRALAIACDLALLGVSQDARILDIGCSTGTISRLLSEIGYRVTGVESDIVAGVQQWQSQHLLAGVRRNMEGPTCRLIDADILDFLESNTEVYDVALLLSVLHHFLEGYGYQGVNTVERGRFARFLRLLCSRVRSYLYVEVPGPDEHEEMPPDPAQEFLFPGYFVQAGLATDIQVIASTVATNGKPRRLYRVDLT